ncbi:MAG TPA: hypothetical protein VIY98_07515 [Nitrososphaeraceae archaeon]
MTNDEDKIKINFFLCAFIDFEIQQCYMNNNNTTQTIVGACESFGYKDCKSNYNDLIKTGIK